MGLAADNNRPNRYGDYYRRNLFKDFGNVEQVYNNPLANIAEGVRILHENQDMSSQLRRSVALLMPPCSNLTTHRLTVVLPAIARTPGNQT